MTTAMQQQQPGIATLGLKLGRQCPAAMTCHVWDLLEAATPHCSHLHILPSGAADAPKAASQEKELSVKIPEPVNRGSFSHQGQLLSPEPSANSSTNYDADRWGRFLPPCKRVAVKQPLALPGTPLVTCSHRRPAACCVLAAL